MTEEIVFYHNPRSRAQMVHWMLEEAGAPYRIVPIDFEKGEHKAPAFLAINPMGKLPTSPPSLKMPCAAPTIAGCSSAPAASSPRSSTR
jgi:hypothetical protein